MPRVRAIPLIILGVLCLPGLVHADTPTELVIWGVWNREGWRKCFDEFERRHPDIKLVTSASGGRMDEQKLMCGIAGGAIGPSGRPHLARLGAGLAACDLRLRSRRHAASWRCQ
jgi:ABC-type glycerol-3-phosphate transport system substrate-binding protein